MLLDTLYANCSIATDTRKYDADGALTTVRGQRCEEGIDGPAKLPRRRRRREVENFILDSERGILRDDEDTVLFDSKAILGCHHGNGALRAEQLD